MGDWPTLIRQSCCHTAEQQLQQCLCKKRFQ